MSRNNYYYKNKVDKCKNREDTEDEFENDFDFVQDENENDLLNCERNCLNREPLLQPIKSDSLKLFLNQDINEIRKESEPFCDSQFKPSLNQIVKNSSSKLAEYLLLALGINIPELKEIKSRIKWKRCKVC